MFIEALILAIIIGFITKGRLINIGNANIKNIQLVYVSFFIEALIILLIKQNVISIGITTFILNSIMYTLLFAFIYLNRNNTWIVLIGAGFVLNALAIFINGGMMPVSKTALESAGLYYNDVSMEGLYILIDENTKLWFLGDIIPYTVLRNFVVSIGDIISAVGLAAFIISSMHAKSSEKTIEF